MAPEDVAPEDVAPDDVAPDDVASDDVAPDTDRVLRVLVLCLANRCRSPLAAALLGQALVTAGARAEVSSAGFLPPGHRAEAGTRHQARLRGLDLDGHRSRRVSAADVVAADVVLCLDSAVLREAVVLDPASWPKTFTLAEAAGRAQSRGPRGPGETPQAWVARLHAGRTTAEVLAAGRRLDVSDPMGGPASAFAAMAQQVAELIDSLTGALVVNR